MSNLEAALNKISDWVEQNQPSLLSYLQPSLSNFEIDRILQENSFNFHPTIYDLYKWHDGVDFYTPPKRLFGETVPVFNSLIDAISLSKDLAESDMSEDLYGSTPWDAGWLPIFGNEDDDLLFINCNDVDDLSLYFWWTETRETGVAYKSLESMILGIAECYESGAYYLEASGELILDSSLERSILEKYNDYYPLRQYNYRG
jgi:cell wall assembly regulator SMI1